MRLTDSLIGLASAGFIFTSGCSRPAASAPVKQAIIDISASEELASPVSGAKQNEKRLAGMFHGPPGAPGTGSRGTGGPPMPEMSKMPTRDALPNGFSNPAMHLPGFGPPGNNDAGVFPATLPTPPITPGFLGENGQGVPHPPGIADLFNANGSSGGPPTPSLPPLPEMHLPNVIPGQAPVPSLETLKTAVPPVSSRSAWQAAQKRLQHRPGPEGITTAISIDSDDSSSTVEQEAESTSSVTD